MQPLLDPRATGRVGLRSDARLPGIQGLLVGIDPDPLGRLPFTKVAGELPGLAGDDRPADRDRDPPPRLARLLGRRRIPGGLDLVEKIAARDVSKAVIDLRELEGLLLTGPEAVLLPLKLLPIPVVAISDVRQWRLAPPAWF